MEHRIRDIGIEMGETKVKATITYDCRLFEVVSGERVLRLDWSPAFERDILTCKPKEMTKETTLYINEKVFRVAPLEAS